MMPLVRHRFWNTIMATPFAAIIEAPESEGGRARAAAEAGIAPEPFCEGERNLAN